jgi:hypothetical protein
MTKPNPLFHSERPWEVLRDTIIVNRPYNDPTEFQIVAVVDASECGLEAAKDNAKFIVEAVNKYDELARALDQLIWAVESQSSGVKEHALAFAKSAMNNYKRNERK